MFRAAQGWKTRSVNCNGPWLPTSQNFENLAFVVDSVCSLYTASRWPWLFSFSIFRSHRLYGLTNKQTNRRPLSVNRIRATFFFSGVLFHAHVFAAIAYSFTFSSVLSSCIPSTSVRNPRIHLCDYEVTRLIRENVCISIFAIIHRIQRHFLLNRSPEDLAFSAISVL